MLKSHRSRLLRLWAAAAGTTAAVLTLTSTAAAQTPPHRLDENCIVSVLNRNVRVKPDGSWVLPNIPANFGLVRARATCVVDGETISGESAPFLVAANAAVDVPPIVLGPTTPIPTSLTLTGPPAPLTQIGATAQLSVMANYPGGTTTNVAAAATGTRYVISNPAIATITANGLVTGLASGTVVIQATNEGTAGFTSVQVVLSADSDGDGLADDLELSLGLNPNNPADALEDADRDGASNRAEALAGSNLRDPDSDDDGLTDGEELQPGADGFVTNPLSADTDGDGVRDALEVASGSDPTSAGSVNLAQALESLSVAPLTFSITVNSVIGVGSVQLTVTGRLRDGTAINLTSTARGTNYGSSDLNVCNFGAPDGRVFGSANGPCTITVTNSGFTATATGTVSNFTPTALASVGIPGYANNVDVNGAFAYVAAGGAGLVVVNVGTPTAPVIVATLDTPGNANDVRVLGNRVFIADGSAGLRIVDVTNPSQPVLLGTVDTAGEANDVVVSGNYAYVADGVSGIAIIDISRPTAPALVRTVDTPGIARGVDVEGTTLVVGDDAPSAGLRVIDVTNPAAAAMLGTLSLAGPVIDIDLSNGVVAIAGYTSGTQLVDVRVPAAPVLRGSLPGSAPGGFVPRDVQMAGQFALYAEQLFANAVAPIVDVSNPAQPFFRGVLDFGQDYAGTGIAVSGPFVYWTGQSFVVSSENGVSGTTRLFIGQYIAVEDKAAVPPAITITEPLSGTFVIEGSEVVVRATASDDVGVSSVTFTVNGAPGFIDTSEPYEARLLAPAAGTPFVLGATAADYGGNAASAPTVAVTVIPDPLTTVAGRVVDKDGNPVGGATVAVFETFTATSAGDGQFVISGVPTVRGPIAVSAEALIAGQRLIGRSSPVAPVAGGQTSVGDVTIRYGSILYFADAVVGTDRMPPALAASGYPVTTATSLADFATKIATGDYRLGILFEQNQSGSAYDTAFSALAAHIAAGGAAIAADWTRNGSHATAFQTSFAGSSNNATVTVTDQPLSVGVTNPVLLTNPGWGTFSYGMSGASGTTCAATFSNGQCAMVVGNGGRTIFNGFLSDTPSAAQGQQLFLNQINAVLGR
jgi:hypothetical protein